MNDIFAAVDFSSVSTWAAGAGVLIIGIAMVFKAIDLGKRAIGMAGDDGFVDGNGRFTSWEDNEAAYQSWKDSRG